MLQASVPRSVPVRTAIVATIASAAINVKGRTAVVHVFLLAVTDLAANVIKKSVSALNAPLRNVAVVSSLIIT